MGAGLCIRNGRVSLGVRGRGFEVQVAELEIAPGHAVALTGESGSGKTLVLELLGLLRAPGPGMAYTCAGQDLAGLWAAGPRSAALARSRGRVFGFVPQTGGLVPFLTVADNIALPQRLTGRVDTGWCATLIDRLGLDGTAGLYPGDLSIGQRQRTAIARALAHRPPVVIADEPTAALDPARADAVLALLLETAQEGGSTLILSSHDTPRLERLGIDRLSLHVTPGEPPVSRLQAGRC
ncbi:putative ABC transport system ATP-binding protein [Cribrihabitans marinus]|uniref:Putative ABC transport system ATP-binding protein n=1 Tax=Cribrihabitans marinus TaxID=1227549 RepID=A0A1H6TUT1_9RHOB|nr:ATP-binding cassette domain-containing protein [Cribrihabitans marinus]GGH21295.1 ABC transporter [Cribrihabitans marinus]SEI83828.1 putative ABC transport system ATP-binding protein [Cribrihabitans marinus]